MQRSVARLFLLAFAAPLAAGLAHAEEFLCQRANGCTAVVDTPHGRTEVAFHDGDVISTDAGWIVDTGDGWTSLARH